MVFHFASIRFICYFSEKNISIVLHDVLFTNVVKFPKNDILKNKNQTKIVFNNIGKHLNFYNNNT